MRQSQFTTKRRESQIVLEAHSERLAEQSPNSRIAGTPGPIEPFEGSLGIVS